MSNRASSVPSSAVVLRDVTESDLPTFFAHQLDTEANRMAAFTPKDPSDEEAFAAHWAKIMSNEKITKKTILYKGSVAGHVSIYPQAGELEVTYWIGKEYWGKGIATAALSELLNHVKVRPLFARVAKDNAASIRVLQKCGFSIVGEDKGFADGRGEDVEEFILKLGECETAAVSLQDHLDPGNSKK